MQSAMPRRHFVARGAVACSLRRLVAANYITSALKFPVTTGLWGLLVFRAGAYLGLRRFGWWLIFESAQALAR